MFAAKAGYRYRYQDYEDNGFVGDMLAHGFCLGLGIRFQQNAEGRDRTPVRWRQAGPVCVIEYGGALLSQR
jgi:hypothetical protein